MNLFFIFLFGLFLGSFLNCLIWRLRVGESILGRSYCPNCRKQIPWHDNVPVLSFIFLKGRCRYCKERISIQYPLLEIIFALLFLLVFLSLSPINTASFQSILSLVRDWLFIFVLAIVFVYDLRWQEVPMIIIWPAIIILFLLSSLIETTLLTVILSTIIASLFFLFQYLLTKGKGLGEGDIWLGALLGSRFVDFKALSLAIFSAYMIGSIFAIFLLIKKKKDFKSKLPLGPFLVLGALISLFFGEKIINWYLSLILF